MNVLNEQNQNLVDSGLVFVDFWAEWCAPCRAMSPIFENIAPYYPDIVFAKNNIEEYSELAKKMNVISIPTFIFFENGIEKFRIVGTLNEQTFVDTFEHKLQSLN